MAGHTQKTSEFTNKVQALVSKFHDPAQQDDICGEAAVLQEHVRQGGRGLKVHPKQLAAPRPLLYLGGVPCNDFFKRLSEVSKPVSFG